MKEGATLITGGQRLTENGLDKGRFSAYVMRMVRIQCVAQEEIFGPVATVIKFETEEEVIRLANDSEYGLGGAVFSQDINVAYGLLVVYGQVGCGSTHTINCLRARHLAVIKIRNWSKTHKSMLDAYTQMKNIYIVTKKKQMDCIK